ncbi:hypothetical protein PLICBS_000073 [Purpureocillium lilacinum]|uniref:uncharacterized protein n=1 Tax=Purpureocillium lilacinum TaxID=33203 RepID=UPI00207FD051|nr:hypothetical protein PLICBS_000073 [Purpureocillium lilacinum]
MTIKTVGVVGTGVIGASWTGLFLAHGLHVLVSDPAPGAEKKLADYLKSIWPTLEGVGLARNASLSNYKFVGSSLEEHYAEVDFVQENAPERPGLKTKLIGEIDAGTRSDVVIASSSSGIPSSQFISEFVPHPRTHQARIQEAIDFYKSLGRHPVHIKQEIPGFVANRLQAVLCNEAYSLVSRGVLSAEDLDACMTTSLGPRWAVTGPLLANAMGGGGGSDGFRHLLEHLGPASQEWMKDVTAHSFKWDQKSIDSLSASVGRELKDSDIRALESERDNLLVQFFRLKNRSQSGAA